MESRVRMLIVEDDQEIRSMLAQQFETEDFIVETTGDGVLAFSMIKENDYDLVLLDLKLPGMDGMTLLRGVNRIGRLPNVIVLTAVNDLSTAQECMKLGAKDFISKPYDPEELLGVIIRTLSA